jgi:hypothetical protein
MFRTINNETFTPNLVVGSATVTGNISATTVTGATGLIATAGGVTATSGNIAATTGSVSAGSTVTGATGLIATTGGVNATAGNIVATTGNITATAGSVSAGSTVTGATGLVATAGGVTATAGNITATAGSVSAGSTVTGATGLIATAGGVTATAGNIVATAGNITATAGSVSAASANITGAISAGSLTIPNSITASSTTTEFNFNTLTVPFVEATTVSASAGMTLPVYTVANRPSTGTIGQIINISDLGGAPAVWNTSTGVWANLGSTTSGQNTVLGDNALRFNTTGTLNTALGVGALQFRSTDGTNNTTFTNCVGLGQDSRVSGDNQVQLGSTTTTVYAQAALSVRSDRRDKADIRDSVLGLEFINKVRPVEFRWNYRDDYFIETEEKNLTPIPNDGSKTRTRFHQGVIAQEVKAVMDEMGVDFSGYQDHTINGGCDVMTIGYTDFIGPLIKSIQELTARVALLEASRG